MPRKTRSARIKRRKSKKRSQSGGGGGYGGNSPESPKHLEGLDIYRSLYQSKELQRREALKAAGAKPEIGDPCTPLFGPFSQCKGYPKVKCSKPVYEKPSFLSKDFGYESRCIEEGRELNPNYDVGHFYNPMNYRKIPRIMQELTTMGY